MTFNAIDRAICRTMLKLDCATLKRNGTIRKAIIRNVTRPIGQYFRRRNFRKFI